jgi:CheY-like chemotaxis protein
LCATVIWEWGLPEAVGYASGWRKKALAFGSNRLKDSMEVSLLMRRHYNEEVTPKAPIRTLVVEDFSAFRQYVCSTLQQQRELTIVGEAEDGLTAVRMASALQPQLILLDVGLPELNGIEAAERILELVPDCKILVLSQEFSPQMVEQALALGARGWVVKAHVHRDLLAALKAVLEGKLFCSRELQLPASVEAAG